MAFPSLATFYLGLFLIVIGTGLLKGNVSVIVGQLYAKDDIRRDAGFSIFYMGINLGAFIAPLVCGYLGQNVNWHIGFAAAGVGMVARRRSSTCSAASTSASAGLHPAPAASPEAGAAAAAQRAPSWAASSLLAAGRSFGIGAYTGALPVTPKQVADGAGYFLLIVIVVFFGWLFMSSDWTPEERKRLYVDRRVLPRRRALLVGLRAGRLDAEPVRRSRHANVDLRLELPEQLVPVAELAVHLGASRRCSPGSGSRLGSREPSTPPSSRSA